MRPAASQCVRTSCANADLSMVSSPCHTMASLSAGVLAVSGAVTFNVGLRTGQLLAASQPGASDSIARRSA